MRDFAARFDAAMERLGPFGAAPRLAVGVSGGADSMALALLAAAWAAARGGAVLALVVDHGLRAEAGAEAALTAARLAVLGVETRVIALGLAGGAGVQARARAARHAALASAARAAGALFLLLGHHAADQGETVAMRAARGDRGREGMAGWTAREDVLVLRPLLGEAPAALRAFLRDEGVAWVEDPSNRDERFERVRVRRAGGGMAPADAGARRAAEGQAADFLARHAVLRPEGFAVVRVEGAPVAALAALLRCIGGAEYAPDWGAVEGLAARLRPASLGGVLVAKTGRFGGGWLVAREPAACAAPVPARAGALWDGRFRLDGAVESATLGALGEEAARFRAGAALPAVVMRGLPCLRRDGEVIFPAPARFAPPAPAAPHPFFA